jgi:hypothetical protein
MTTMGRRRPPTAEHDPSHQDHKERVMNFTVELRYESGSQTVLSVDADSADEALAETRDQRRVLVGIHITAPSETRKDADSRRDEPRETASTYRRIPAQHRRSRRS